TGGDPGFYATAATLQAALRGSERVLTDEALDHFVEMNRVNAKKLTLDADLVLVHDVQPATLVAHRPERGRWVWACHFDASRPHVDLLPPVRQPVRRRGLRPAELQPSPRRAEIRDPPVHRSALREEPRAGAARSLDRATVAVDPPGQAAAPADRRLHGRRG